MKKKTMAKTAGIMAIGAVIGAGAGIMFAPKKGSETREDLKNLICDLKEKIGKIKLKDTKKYLENKVKQLEIDLDNLTDDDTLDNIKQKSKDILNNIEELLQTAKDKGEKIIEETVFNLKNKAIEVTEDIQKKLEKSK